MATSSNIKKTVSGLDRNTAAALSYVGLWVTGIIFFLVEKDKFVRFHALQSTIAFGILNILLIIPVVRWVLTPFVMIGGFILWLICIIKAYQGEEFILPFIGLYAKKKSKES